MFRVLLETDTSALYLDTESRNIEYPKLHNTWKEVFGMNYNSIINPDAVVPMYDAMLAFENFNPMMKDSNGDTFYGACLRDILTLIYNLWSLGLQEMSNIVIEKIKPHWRKIRANSSSARHAHANIYKFLILFSTLPSPEELCKHIEIILFPDFIDYSNAIGEKVGLYVGLMTQFQIVNYENFALQLIFPPWIMNDTENLHYGLFHFFIILSKNKINMYQTSSPEIQRIIDVTLPREDTALHVLKILTKYYGESILTIYPNVLSHPYFINAWCSSWHNEFPLAMAQSELLHKNAVIEYITYGHNEADVRQFITLRKNTIDPTITNRDGKTACMAFLVKFKTPPPEELYHDPYLSDFEGNTVMDYWMKYIDYDGKSIPAALKAPKYTCVEIGCEHVRDADEAYAVNKKLYCNQCCDTNTAKKVFNSLKECDICTLEYEPNLQYAVFNNCGHVLCKVCADRSIHCPFCRSSQH